MTEKQVYAMIRDMGLPNAYREFEETGQQPPFICFYFPYDNDMLADDSNYQGINHLIIELYTDNKDFELETTVENVLRSYGMVWTKNEEYIDSEKMNEVIYEMDVIITEV